MKRFWIRRGARFLSVALVAIGLAGWLVMTLWNALLPTILGVATISFWQALGLLLLSRILFGGPGWRGGYGPRGGPGWGHAGRAEWKRKMAERWEQLTPEQRQQMKTTWRGRWGGSPPHPPGPASTDE